MQLGDLSTSRYLKTRASIVAFFLREGKREKEKEKKRKEKKRKGREGDNSSIPELWSLSRDPIWKKPPRPFFENIQYRRFTLLFTEKNRGEEKSFTMLHAHLSVILSHYFQTATRRKMKITSIRSQLYITEHGGSSFDAKKK